MPPRPRPRPKTAAASSSSTASASAQSSTPTRNTNTAEDDDDSFFIRKVSAAERRRYDQLNEESERTTAAASTSQDDSDGEVTKPGTGRWRKKAKSPSAQPVGTRRHNLPKKLYISSDNDEKSDSSFEILDTPGASSDTKGKKRARSRSRSKSLTPPPALPQHQIQYAKDLVRMALSTERPPSPKSGEESDDHSVDEDLDPELAKIRQQVRTRQRTSPLPLYGEEGQRNTSNVDVIIVKWQPHPRFSTGKGVSWSFMLGHMETFRKIFEEVSKKTGIIFDNIVMTYNSKRIFSSASPHMLSIYTQAELVACEKSTYEYLRANRETLQSPSPLLELGGSGEHDQTGQESETELQAEGDDNEDDDNDDTFKVIVRSSLTTKDITLIIRPTTTCGAIVKGFLKKAGLTDQYAGTDKNKKNPVLSVDGERMSSDAPIGDADLEEGDIVDVVGL